MNLHFGANRLIINICKLAKIIVTFYGVEFQRWTKSFCECVYILLKFDKHYFYCLVYQFTVIWQSFVQIIKVYIQIELVYRDELP